MKLTKTEIEWIENHLNTIKTIVINASCSAVTAEFRSGMIAIGKKYGYVTCDHCNTELYLTTSRIYDLYREQKKSKNNAKTKNKENS